MIFINRDIKIHILHVCNWCSLFIYCITLVLKIKAEESVSGSKTFLQLPVAIFFPEREQQNKKYIGSFDLLNSVITTLTTKPYKFD